MYLRNSFRYILTILVATLVLGCSDNSDSPASFNVRVFGVDEEGSPVELVFLTWGYGTPQSPEGTTEVLCGTVENEETCTALDVGFEAQGEIWIRAVSPLPSSDPFCFYSISGESRMIATPNQPQNVIIILDQFSGICS